MGKLAEKKGTSKRKPKCSAGCWKPAFLRTLAKNANVSAASEAAGITRVRAYQVKNEDPEFSAAWDEALETALDGLEEVTWTPGSTLPT